MGRILSLIWIFLVASAGFAADVPRFASPVVDQVGLLSQSESSEIIALIEKIGANGGPQFAVLIVPTLDNETIEQYAIRVTDQWKLGDAQRDDGLLMVFSTGDRKIRIEVGQGLEGDVTDLFSKRVIDSVIVPNFRQNQYFQGIRGALGELALKLGRLEEGENVMNDSSSKGMRSLPRSLVFVIILFLFLLVRFLVDLLSSPFDPASKLGGRSYRGGGFGGGGFGGGGGYRGGGFGGGFGGGGGGGFSGGGASGGW